MSDFSIIVLGLFGVLIVIAGLEGVRDIVVAFRQSDSPCKCKDKTPKT